MNKPKLVVFTGSGISAESGIQTFRDAGGLWEKYRVEDVCTPDAWKRNPELVLNFYNDRRKQLLATSPNQAHILITKLEDQFDVKVITQNIDNLHEKAGSSNVLHLHGELMKSRSSLDKSLIYDIDDTDIKLGDKCEKGSQLRPHIVWFGEDVPNMSLAIEITKTADIFCVVGTSLAVYPAASLLYYAPKSANIYLIDPNPPTGLDAKINVIADVATKGMEKFDMLIRK